jgi:hypothetical protein
MSFVDIHPHFVSARGYDDLKTVVGLLKDPIDDDDFERPDNAPFLPQAYTSTIHITDSLNGLASTSSSASRNASMAGKAKLDKVVVSTADDAHAPFGDNNTGIERSPLAANLENGSRGPFATTVPKSNAPPASTTEFRIRHRASSYHRTARQPKILCVWDVDDTLVATGVSGVRQNLVFKEPELLSLFRSAGPNTRHLLLSQGSIDDVFEESGGRLRCIQKFVQRAPPAPETGRRSTPSAKASGNGSSATHSKQKEKSFFTSMLRCGAGKQTKEQPSSSSAAKNDNRGVCSTDEHDMRHFAPGTVVVRLSSVHDRSEQPTDAAFLTNPAKQPTCRRTSTVPLDEKAERMGRWLILRPEVWGITLAPMSTIFPPSRCTAFVNGKVYRKMDVVWSLAMTGEWDSVFFVDNNLSEVGVVRYGMQMSDVLNLRSGRQVWRFFQSEFLLLAASAKLREMELRYGRDVTKPPPQQQANEQDKRSNKNAADKAAKQKDGDAKSAESSGELRVKSAGTGSGDGAGEGGELTPSKSTPSSSIDDGACDSKLPRHRSRRATEAPPEVHVDVEEEIQIIDRADSTSSPAMPGDLAGGSSTHSECLSLASASPQHSKELAPRFPTTPAQSSKDVDLVVVNLHMSCEVYRRVLTAARTNSDGQRALLREGSLPPRFVGQPVFIGDRSCTDEQYDAILKYFQETESGLFQLLEEEMRSKGYVDLNMGKRWIPKLSIVNAPIRRRPTFIPHMPQYYTPFFDEVEERVVKGLQKLGGTSASCTLHSEAQRQYFALQRLLPFIDPYLTGDLGRILFDIYIVDGNIPRSLAEHLKKILNRTRERIVQKEDRK